MKAISNSNKASITFMAKPEANKCGSSSHLHMSLFNSDYSKNLFYDGNDYKLTETMNCSNTLLYFLGGLMKYSLDLFILFAPTINSYKRYKYISSLIIQKLYLGSQ